MNCSLYVIFFAFIVSSCVSLEIPIPGNRFILPETSGALGHGKVNLAAGSSTNIVLVRDIDENPQETDNPDLRSGSQVSFGGTLGLWDHIDIHLDTAQGLGGVVQVVGDSARAAKKGNLSLAVQGHVGGASNDKSVDSSSRSYTVKGTAKATNADYGIILGYRTDDDALIYLGVDQTRVTASGSVIKTARDTGTSTTYETDKSRGISNAMNIGFHIGESQGLFLTLETGYSVTTWPHLNPYSRVLYGISCGYAW